MWVIFKSYKNLRALARWAKKCILEERKRV